MHILIKFGLISLFFAMSAHASFALATDEIARIKKSGVLKVAYSPEETPPFIYLKDSKRVGLDVELAEAMAEKLGVKLEWVQSEHTYSGIFELLQKNKVDLAVSDLFPTLDRLVVAQFSHPYIQVKQILFVQRFRAAKLKLGDRYEEVTIKPGMTYGYYPEAGFVDGLLKHSIDAAWVAYEDEGVKSAEGSTEKSVAHSALAAKDKPARERMMRDFTKGQLTGVWIDELELAKWRKIRPDVDLYGYVVPIPQADIPISVAVRADSSGLLEWVNLFIDYAKRGDALKRIYAHHLRTGKKTGEL